MPIVNSYPINYNKINFTSTVASSPRFAQGSSLERTPAHDGFSKNNGSSGKWYKNPLVYVLGVPLILAGIDLACGGKHLKKIFSQNPISNEESKLLKNTRNTLHETREQILNYESEMQEIKKIFEEHKTNAEKILGKDLKSKTVGNFTYKKDALGNIYVEEVSKNGLVQKFSYQRGVLTTNPLSSTYRLNRYNPSGKISEKIQMETSFSLEEGDKFARIIYDKSGNKTFEHLNAAGGSVLTEFNKDKVVRQFERTRKELLGDYIIKHKEMDGIDNITNSIEINNDVLKINEKTYDKNSLGKSALDWFWN